MPTFRYGGKGGAAYDLELSDDYVMVRTEEREALDPRSLSRAAADALSDLELVFRFPSAGVEIHRVRAPRGRRAARDRARAVLRDEDEVATAGRVLRDRAGVPVVYTENLFVKLRDELAESACRKLIERHGLEVKRPIHYLANGYFAAAREGSGLEVFAAAERLLAEAEVELCHPELVRPGRQRALFPQQWHLHRTTIDGRDIDAHVDVEGAWSVTFGEGVTIAVIDDGFDIDHEELVSPGKIVSPHDATLKTSDPRPGSENKHGTACAGVACAEGLHGACGVAPRARLMPVRLDPGTGSQNEADAIQWAAEHGADVISCSWGPKDGDWRRPEDPLHQAVHPLPDATRLALEWATDHGRDGRGCVVTWAAGNGNESVDNDGYASYPRAIAVAACNCDGKRCAYSDFGDAVWCAFPSKDGTGPARKFGIWTTDLSGPAGYNPGLTRRGDRKGNYTKSFTGTSSACPGVAGVAALVLAANPDLGWQEVRDLIRRSCDVIDAAEGKYDAEGHSPFYGYGRINAARAVALARAPAAPAPGAALARSPAPAPRTAPARAEVVVRFTGEVAERWLAIDDCRLSLVDGEVRLSLDVGETYVLSWWLSGTPGTEYRIEVEPAETETGELEVAGALPVERRIALDREKSAGTRKLTVRRP